MEYVKGCDRCQRFEEVTTRPQRSSTPSLHLGPFTNGGFGLPAEIVSNNKIQFASRLTMGFCTQLKIKQQFTSVEHPQSNGQAKTANKRRLEEANKGRWVEELPQVLWSYHTTPYSSTNETPFCLTFSIETVILVEIGEPPPRTTLFQSVENKDKLRVNLDLLQEACEVAQIKEYNAFATKQTEDQRPKRTVIRSPSRREDKDLKGWSSDPSRREDKDLRGRSSNPLQARRQRHERTVIRSLPGTKTKDLRGRS
ncbi:hypothetical protein CR513_12136, partial [Mucuna pruriens]